MRCYSIALARDGFGVLGMSLSQQIAAITALVSLRSEKEAATVVKKSAGRKAALARWQGRKHFREPQIGSWTSSPSHSLIVAVDGLCFGVNKARVDQVPRGTLPVTYLPICPFPRTRVSIRFSMSTIVSLNASWISCSTVLSPVSARYNDTDFGTEKQKS